MRTGHVRVQHVMLDLATCIVHLQHGTTKLTLYLCAFANVTHSVAACDMQHRGCWMVGDVTVWLEM